MCRETLLCGHGLFCVQTKKRDAWFFGIILKFIYPSIPLLWSKESKESDKEIAWSLHFVKPES
jgi:hypothetical protein